MVEVNLNHAAGLIQVAQRNAAQGNWEGALLAMKLANCDLKKAYSEAKQKTDSKADLSTLKRRQQMTPKCPECGKLGVQMVETSTKWLCPRCNYKVKKAASMEVSSNLVDDPIIGSILRGGKR